MNNENKPRLQRLSLEEIKKTELNILLEFQKICDENGLTFYLCGGSLLGAIRHKGFIPWDDDIDLGIPREQYEYLLANIQPHLPEYLKVSLC